MKRNRNGYFVWDTADMASNGSMEILVYRTGADRVEEGFKPKDLPALISDQSNVVWVDMQGETEPHIEIAKDTLLNVLNFHPLTIEDCVEIRNQPKIEAFPNYLFMIVHGIKPGETGPTNFATKELDCYLGSNFVVTFHIERFVSIKSVKQRIRSSSFICERGAAYLLHSILDELIDHYMPIVDDFDKSINDFEDRVFEMGRSSNDVLGEIMDLRRSVARLRRISARQLEVLYRLSHGEFPQIPPSVLPFYRDVHDHLVRITDVSESYRDLVSSLFEIHFSVVANKTNDVMKTLAVVSAIILPLSLIAGIYGMNFEHMPELRTPYGYFLTLGFMGFLTVILLWYFWRRGWIFQGNDDVAAKNPDANARTKGS
ncbi:magnesium/cobalt transporter CorA [soil metagenome]